MKVEVKPIEIKKWHGKTGKDSYTVPKILRALVDGDTRQYATGLDYVNKEFTDPDNSKSKITEAEYYAKLLKVDLSPQFIEGQQHPFWDSQGMKIKLENNTMYFDTDNPMDYIKIKVMKASKYIANSMKDWEDGLFPEATHVITDEQEEIEVKASKVQIKKKAVLACNEISEDKKVQLILIIDGKNLKGKSSKFIEVELDKLIEKKASDVLRYLEMETEDVAIHALVLEALQKSVLRKQGHKFLYHDSVIGSDIYDVIKYLKDDENQDLKLRIMASVNN